MKPKIEKATRKQFPDGIAEYGTDALRFTFASLATTGRDIRFDMGRIDGYRNFCNKIWNAARYVLMNTENMDAGNVEYSTADLWIRSKLQHTIQDMHRHLDSYRLDLAAQAIYEFTWHEFCDWYLELSKPVLNAKDTPADILRGTQQTLLHVQESILRLLHPIMPFISEEIWLQIKQRAKLDGETIMLQRYPEFDESFVNTEAENDIQWVQSFILGLRQIRGEMDISPGKALSVLLQGWNNDDQGLLEKHEGLLLKLGRIESIKLLNDDEEPPTSATALLNEMRILVPLAGLIDIEAERERLNRQRSKVTAELTKAEAKLANDKFVANAPAAVVEQERERIINFAQQLAQLETQLRELEKDSV